MLSLVSLCSAIFQNSTPLQMNFSSMFQSYLDPLLNTKSVHNYVLELLHKIGNVWGPGFYVYNFFAYLPDFTLLLVSMSFDV
jgi:hypothetical protein